MSNTPSAPEQQIDDLEDYLQAEHEAIDSAPEVPAEQRNLRPFDGFAGGGAASTPREIDGVPYADLD